MIVAPLHFEGSCLGSVVWNLTHTTWFHVYLHGPWSDSGGWLMPFFIYLAKGSDPEESVNFV